MTELKPEPKIRLNLLPHGAIAEAARICPLMRFPSKTGTQITPYLKRLRRGDSEARTALVSVLDKLGGSIPDFTKQQLRNAGL